MMLVRVMNTNMYGCIYNNNSEIFSKCLKCVFMNIKT